MYDAFPCRYLHRAIQGGSHDSVEDARGALELVKLKLKYGADFGTPKSRSGPRQGIPLPMAIAEKGHRTCFVDRINMLKKFVADNCSGVSVDSDEAAVCPPRHAVVFFPVLRDCYIVAVCIYQFISPRQLCETRIVVYTSYSTSITRTGRYHAIGQTEISSLPVGCLAGRRCKELTVLCCDAHMLLCRCLFACNHFVWAAE